jgi:predicted solute-binding protein
MVQKGEIDAGILTIDQIPLIENLKLKVVVDLDEEYSKLFGTYAVPAVIAAKKTLNKSTIRKTLECIEKALELSYEYRLNISNSFLKEYGTNMTDLRVYKEGNFKIFTPWG